MVKKKLTRKERFLKWWNAPPYDPNKDVIKHYRRMITRDMKKSSAQKDINIGITKRLWGTIMWWEGLIVGTNHRLAPTAKLEIKKIISTVSAREGRKQMKK